MPDPWQAPPISHKAKALARALGVPEMVGALLVNRNIHTVEEAREFFQPKLSSLIDPSTFPDMDWGTRLIAEALTKGGNILVYGDYDADGITATACLYHFLSRLGAKVSYVIPNRFSHGYGVHASLVEPFLKKGPLLLLTVDCGTSDLTQLEALRKKGLQIVVTDHHRVFHESNYNWPVINPKRLKEPSLLGDISGVGTAFYLLMSLRRYLRKRGFFRQRKEPDLKEYLDLVAIGMVADRIHMRNQARILISHGLYQLRHTKWPTLDLIKEFSGITGRHLTTDDIGFRIAPRLNAPGRLEDPLLVMDSLLSQDQQKVRQLVEVMESLNNKRKNLEDQLLRDIENLMQENPSNGLPCMVYHGEDWHEGVLGLVASRLVTKYYRPALLLRAHGQFLKGSGRSIPGIDLYELIKEQARLLDRFGGHSGAVGLTMHKDYIESFKEGLVNSIETKVDQSLFQPKPHIDMELRLTELRFEEIRSLNLLEPFGDGNPEPVFLARGVEVVAKKEFGTDHLRLILREKDKIFGALGYGMLSKGHLAQGKVDILYTPRQDLFKGHEVIELKLVAIRPCLTPSP